MRVLLATMQYGRGYGQGTERYVSMLADGLLRAGGRVVIVGGDPERRGPALRLGDEVRAGCARGDDSTASENRARLVAAPTAAESASGPGPARMGAQAANDEPAAGAGDTNDAPSGAGLAAGAGGRPGQSASLRILHAPTPSRLSIMGTAPRVWQTLLNREQPELVHLINPGHIGVGIAAAAHALGRPVIITIVDYWWLCPKQTLLHHSGRICDGDVPWRECLRCLGAEDRRPWLRGVARVPLVRGLALPTLYFGRALAGGMALEEVGRWTQRRQILREVLDAASAVIFLSQGARQRIAPLLSHPRLHTIQVGLEPRWFGRTVPGVRRAAHGGSEPPPPSEPRPQARESRPCANGERRMANGGHASPVRGTRDTDPGAPRNPATVTIGFVGALKPHKGPHVLLAAVQQLGWSRTRVRLIGNGDDRRYLARLRALAQGLNVEVVGHVPTEQMPNAYATLDLLVVPSLWPENLPQTVLEATAMGVPVIASDVDGISEVVTDPRARFAVGDATALAACLAAWCADPTLGTAAQPRTAQEMVADTLAVYRAAL